MDLCRELRNEADGVYDRQPEFRYQRLLRAAADEIDRLTIEHECNLWEAAGAHWRLVTELGETKAELENLRKLVLAWADCQDTHLYGAKVQALMTAIGR